jgi:hypothetical protein
MWYKSLFFMAFFLCILQEKACEDQVAGRCRNGGDEACENPLSKADVFKAMKLLWPTTVYQALITSSSSREDAESARRVMGKLRSLRRNIAANARQSSMPCLQPGTLSSDYMPQQAPDDPVFSKSDGGVDYGSCH